jgi:hypothetical protein
MKVNILTPDSKMPNLAAMKIASYHRTLGDNVGLNRAPNMFYSPDLTYASIIFNWTPDPYADLIGGPKYPESCLPPEIEYTKPSYSIYPLLDHSMGYTYKNCPRTCSHCIVPKQNNPDTHHSIWTFHDEKFKKIKLMNNNTLADPQFRETIDEIVDANLTVMDESGWDARLITEETAHQIKRLRFDNYIHVAWDFYEHEIDVLTGIRNLISAKVKKIMCYILIGKTTHEENLDRVWTLHAMKVLPFVMPLDKKNKYQKNFARWVNRRYYQFIPWKEYRKT